MDDLLIIVLTLVFTVLALINQNKRKTGGKRPDTRYLENDLPWREPEFETFSAEQATETPVRPYVKKTGPVKEKNRSPDRQEKE